MVPASDNNGSESADKEVLFFWFKDSSVVEDAGDGVESVILRVLTENKVLDILLHLDEKSDVYQSEPEAVPIGVHGGILVLNQVKYSLNEFEVFRNRNRVVLKINSDILPTYDSSIVDDALSEGSRPSNRSNYPSSGNDANNNPHFYSVSEDDFRSSEEDDLITGAYSSDEQVNVGRGIVASTSNATNNPPAAKPTIEMSFEPERLSKKVESATNDNELHLDLHNFDENLNKMVRKYSKPSASNEKNAKDDVMGSKGRNRAGSGGSGKELQTSPKAQAANTPGRSTPSTVIDRKLSSSGSTPRHLEGDEERIIELENVVSQLHKQCNDKDNDVLRLKKELLEAQRINRSLKGDAESLQQLDSDLIKELKAENQKLKVQLSVVTNEQPQNREIEARYEALFEELEVQKQTVFVLQKENQDLNNKVESLTRALNQSKTFTPIEEELHDEMVEEDECPSNVNSMPTSKMQQNSAASPRQMELHLGETRPEDSENCVRGSFEALHNQMLTGSDSDVMKDRNNEEELPDMGSRKDIAGSAPDLTYTKANIKFLKERLGEWNEKNQLLHDRCSVLEASALCSNSSALLTESAHKTDSDSRGDELMHVKSAPPSEPPFKNLAQISASSDPLEKFRRDLLRDHANLVEETDREIDLVNGHLGKCDPCYHDASMNNISGHYQPTGSERERGDPFMDQRRAALMELEQIRMNLASVKAGLKDEQLKTRDFEWTRLRDNLDKLKKPSELFGSLIQTSEDKLREEIEQAQVSSQDFFQPIACIEECNNPSIAYTDITYQQNKHKLQSPAESVVERRSEKLGTQPSELAASGSSFYYKPCAALDGTESDCTEVLMNMNPCPEPRIIIDDSTRKTTSQSPKQPCRATSVPVKGRRSPVKKRGSVSKSNKGSNTHDRVSETDAITTEIDDDDQDSDATLVSDGGVGNDGIVICHVSGGRKRNPESVYEERLNKSYPSATHRIMKGLTRGDVINSSSNSTFTEDDESNTSVDASTVITDDLWISEYLPKRKSRSSSNKRSSTGAGAGGAVKHYHSNLVAMAMSPNLSSIKKAAIVRSTKMRTDRSKSPLKDNASHLQPISGYSSSGGKLKYYVPRVPSDVSKGDRVKFSRKGGKVNHGLIRYVGSLPGRTDFYLGVELESGEGKHDGSYNGRRYFSCPFRKGVFVSFSKIILCYGSL